MGPRHLEADVTGPLPDPRPGEPARPAAGAQPDEGGLADELDRDLLEALFRNSPLGFCVYDHELRYHRINERLAAINGIPADEHLGKRFRDLLPGVAEQVEPKLLEVLATGEPFTHDLVEVETPAHPGETRSYECIYYGVRSGDGAISAVACIVEDVTDRRRLEDRLHHAQKMEAVGQLAGGIAHDLNNLLTLVSTGLALVTDDVARGRAPASSIQDIEGAVHQASDLISQLLVFSRKQPMRPRRIEVSDVLRRAVPLLDRSLGETVAVRIRTGTEPTTVETDPALLQQAVVNLTLNARDAMPEGGTVHLETGTRVVRDDPTAAPGTYVIVTVRDEGHGMDDATRDRIFEPFFTTKGEERGTGLGLSMVHGFVSQSGGFIEVDTGPGRGATFTLGFPAAVGEPEGAPAGAPGPDPVPRGSETILLVEDQAELRRSLARLLDRLGYDVLQAAGVGEAATIAASRERPIHLVITDVIMPGGSGRRAAEAVTAHHRSAAIVYMSGYTDDVLEPEGPGTPRALFLKKPFPLEQLARTVRAALDRAPSGPGPDGSPSPVP